ncbi:MAG: ATP-binding protein, partial [Cyclobacteriaceae bacterium]
NQFNDAREKGADLFTTHLNFEEKNKFYNELLSYVPGLSAASKDFYLSCPGLAASTVLLENVALYIENFSGVPYTNEVNATLMRFGKAFQQTYTRFLDLQKAEAQARESQIEAALERVRSRSMGMQKSEELKNVIQVVFEQLLQLNFKVDSASFDLNYKESDGLNLWMAVAQQTYPVLISIPYFDNPIFNDPKKAKEDGLDFLAVTYPFDVKNEFFKHFFAHCSVPMERQQYILDGPGFTRSAVFMDTIELSIQNNSGVPFNEEENTILKRFGKTFEQVYIRFLDLQKAELQTRQAQIELGLERLRAHAMAMKKSEELADVIAVVFTELTKLHFALTRAMIWMFDEDAYTYRVWMANSEVDKTPGTFQMPIEHPYHKKLLNIWKERKDKWVYELKGEEKKDLDDYLFTKTIAANLPEEVKAGMRAPERIFNSFSFHNFGGLLADGLEELSEENLEILYRFSKEFDITYTRFLDLQKAEAQAREAQIEAALERVRSKTMAMHNSQDVGETVATLFDELMKLGVEKTIRCGIIIVEDTKQMEVWTAADKNGRIDLIIGRLDMSIHPLLLGAYDAWKNKQAVFIYELVGDDLKDYFRAINNSPDYPFQVDVDSLPFRETNTEFYFGEGAIFTFTLEPIPAEAVLIFKRFAGVFGQTYRRYLDLKKAEAQAREAKIEATLEKVRSRSLAMHNSSELSELVATLFDELIKLDLVLARCIIWILKEDKSAQLWMANSENKQANSYHINGIDHSYYNSIFKGWRERSEHWVYELKDKEKASIDQILLFETELSQLPEEVKRGILASTQTYVAGAFNKFGLIEASGPIRHTGEQLQILHRFNKVFEQSYTRFLDLQKAEAQAREATIEAALEKVRGKAMAMHNSNDLLATASSMFIEVKKLGIKPIRCGVGLLTKDSILATIYRSTSSEEGDDLVLAGTVTLDGHPVITEIYNSTITGEICFPVLKGELLKTYYEKVIPNLKLPDLPPDYTEYGYFLSFKEGFFYGWSARPIVEADIKILNRFKLIIDLSFRRYIELQNAEAQAREAKIEAALERVRGKAMAMHSSEDLTATIRAFYHELELFSITPRRCGVGLLDKETHIAELSTMNTTGQGESIEVIGRIKMVGHPVLEGVFDNWLIQKEYHPVLRGNEIKEYYQLIRQKVAFPEYPNDAVQYGYFFFFTEGGVYAWTEKPLAEDEIKIYRRFTTVLSLTYKRYKDLKDAEARTLLAIRESSLDRVRAGIASMRTAEDLQRITPLVWHELITLGVPFLRCGVFIINEEEKKIHTYLTNPQGKSLAALHLDYNSTETNRKAVEHWRLQKVFIDHWDKAQFAAFAKSLLDKGQIETTNTYLGGEEPPESLTLQFIPFAQGMLYVGSAEPLSALQIELVQVLAEAFSVAYARYEDFTKLELAKAQIEKSLADLKQTQTQLIQSEKMASLGELTAGIAHEIQNPLNFVNNFSEVSNELIKEIQDIRQKTQDQGNKTEEDEILNDIASNLEKINHHGKRAADIVKGMLQHSRSSSGLKEPTDINGLADEYLRLAYHGLRAKDKSFNATMKTDFDERIGKVNVIPQDIGRVILNLITNAFYVVNEKQKAESSKQKADRVIYDPTVFVSTRKEGDKIMISVKDNGNGIPESIKEKIFQPFFTTKPTGQGTGLGLSLSYDIITKGHGGEIKMETKEGEGTEFIIQLPIV